MFEESTEEICKRAMKYIVLTLGFVAMATCNIFAFVLPMWKVFPPGQEFYGEFNVFDVCVLLVSNGESIKCQSYEDTEANQGLALCGTWSSRLKAIRGCGICSIIVFVVGAAFCVERICACAPRLRQGVLNYTHKLALMIGFVFNIACFIMILLLYTTLPSDCIGPKPSSQPGAKIDGSAFLFMTAWICCILYLIMDTKWKDKMDDAASAYVAGDQVAAGGGQQARAAGETESMYGGSNSSNQQQMGRNNSQFAQQPQSYAADDANYKI